MRWLYGFTLLLSCGCIGIYRGGTQGVWLLSDPPGAKVELDGQEGVTPCFKSLDRDGDSVVVKYELAGYAPVEKAIEPQCDAGILVLEFLLDTVIGGLVDLCSGNAYRWPYGVMAKLAPEGGMSFVSETWALPKTPEQARRPNEDEHAEGVDSDQDQTKRARRRPPSVGSQPF